MRSWLLRVVVAAALVLAGCGQAGREKTSPLRESAAVADPAGVLRAWDRRRAHAYAVGDVGLLKSLYAPGASAGSRDVAQLRSYRQRGLRVVDMHMQLLSVRAQRVGVQTRRFVVIDRLAGAVVARGTVRRPLPRDAPSTHVVTLRRRDNAWRVVSVRDLSPGRR